jgi:hypothetical protein
MIGSGNVSLLAVRDDLDLTGNFSLRNDSRGRNKATWDATTDLSLLEYRNNVMGMQEIQRGQFDNKNRGIFQQAFFLSGIGTAEVVNAVSDSQLSFPDKPRATKMIKGRNQGLPTAADNGTEMRHFGQHAGGQHRLRAHVCRKNNNSTLHYSKIAVVCNSAGYLSGAESKVLNDEWGYGSTWIKYEKTVNLPADKPFVTVIVYCISPANSDIFSQCEVEYTALQLDKI